MAKINNIIMNYNKLYLKGFIWGAVIALCILMILAPVL